MYMYIFMYMQVVEDLTIIFRGEKIHSLIHRQSAH